MNDHVWIEMPSTVTGIANAPVRPKYSIDGNAFLVHAAGKVYAILGDEQERGELLKNADCRRLSPSEGRAFEGNLRFPVPQHLFAPPAPPGLGDLVAWIAGKLGFAECSGCRQRKNWLNGIAVWGLGRR
jgi:hypothetical protein